MRILLLTLALLAMSTFAFAADPIVSSDPDNGSTITLTIAEYGAVTVENIACSTGTQALGAGTLTGSGAVDIKSNGGWTLSCPATAALKGIDTFNLDAPLSANLSLSAAVTPVLSVAGSMSDATQDLYASVPFTIANRYGAYSGTVNVTLTW